LENLLKRQSHITLLKSINEEKLLNILSRAPGVLPLPSPSPSSDETVSESEEESIKREKSENNDYLDNLLKAKSRTFEMCDSTVSSISESVVSEVPSEPPEVSSPKKQEKKQEKNITFLSLISQIFGQNHFPWKEILKSGLFLIYSDFFFEILTEFLILQLIPLENK